MMPSNVYPGAVWRPITGGQASDPKPQPPIDAQDCMTLHEAVTTEEQSVFDWVNQEQSCHGFNGRYGYLEQYIEVGLQAWANSGGNHRTLFALESWDGLIIPSDPSAPELNADGLGADQTVWTAEQCERAADLAAWLHVTYGLPLNLMQSSRPTERGIAPHRLGVPNPGSTWPFQLYGGEVWTAHPGKPCPGDLRIAQIPGIVARAQVLAAGIQAGAFTYLPPGAVDLTSALSRGALTEDDMPYTPDQLTQIFAGALATPAGQKAITTALGSPAGQAAISDAVSLPLGTAAGFQSTQNGVTVIDPLNGLRVQANAVRHGEHWDGSSK